VNPGTYYLSFSLWDGAGEENRYALPSSSNWLVPGETIGQSASRCYLPVFPSGRDDSVWYAGSLILDYLYLTFDMTPYDEHGKDYIQIGVAPRNTVNTIGKQYEDATDTTGEDTSKKDDNSTVIPVPTPHPTPSGGDTNTTTDEDDKPVGPEPKPKPPGPIHVDPVTPDKQMDWIDKNGAWIGIVSIISVVLLAAVGYSCWKRK